MQQITYKFIFSDNQEKTITVDLERNQSENSRTIESSSNWTDLKFNQCSRCPLSAVKVQKCPVALDIEELLSGFHPLLPSENVKIWVNSQNRLYFKECDLQTGLKALAGLIMSTSSCPILGRLKGMAYYHLPFASLEESVYRSVSHYLLRQYFLESDGLPADMSLAQFPAYYTEIQSVNMSFFERLKFASASDSNLNVIIEYSSFSMLLSTGFEKFLSDLKKQVL